MRGWTGRPDEPPMGGLQIPNSKLNRTACLVEMMVLTIAFPTYELARKAFASSYSGCEDIAPLTPLSFSHMFQLTPKLGIRYWPSRSLGHVRLSLCYLLNLHAPRDYERDQNLTVPWWLI
jgi:hypothetical protein